MTDAYGYNDPLLVHTKPYKWNLKRWLSLIFAIIFITGVWLALDWKILFGEDWLSETYDNEDWKTNEGDLHTFGMWDLETHIWKTVYIIEHFPHFQWNPYWYLGVPLLKYYQLGFYAVHAAVIFATGTSPARAANLLIIFSHLLATLLTFLLCYKVSRRIWASAFCSIFVLANTFITIRSYGWEPITVVFLFLFPLGLLFFLKQPLKPFRPSVVFTLGLSYLSHPLLWFSLCMSYGLYLAAIALRSQHRAEEAKRPTYLWHYFALVFCSILLGAVQFVPQISYHQATSGAHMGVTYLPYYQVPFNIITLKDFLFDAGNLKGPGPIVMIAFLLLIIFGIIEYRHRKKPQGPMLRKHELIGGLTLTLFTMVLFYYLELWNAFPMNLLRSIQYHRIIPEFIITAATLVAALANIAYSYRHKVIYYAMLICFVLASGIIIYGIQEKWQTTDDIYDRPEFIWDDVDGRISNPYPDQSLSVRNSFTNRPQVYGYYEQGITNSYNDEMFSVSSGFHNTDVTILYLQAANVGRLYINNEEGKRDRITEYRLNGSVEWVETGERYSYFKIPLANPEFAQAIDSKRADEVEELEPGCRVLFKEEYCGSFEEEFIGTDPKEIAYLRAYVDLLEEPYDAWAEYEMVHADLYKIHVSRATEDTAVVVKMTYDEDFVATVDGQEVPIEKFGPDFMLIRPGKAGIYEIHLAFKIPKEILVGLGITVMTAVILLIGFIVQARVRRPKHATFKRGDM